MYCNGRRFFSIYFTVLVALVSFPFAAAAQTGDNRSSLVKTVTGAFSTDVSSDLLQDSSFLAAIKARDSEIALQTQLEEIISFHEDLKDNLSILFGNLPIKLREYYQSMIDDELFRLKTLENDIKSGLYTIGEGAKNFEIGGYPLVLNEKVVIKIPQLSTTESPIEFARRGREKATEVFKNVAPENKQFLYDYQKIFSLMASFGISNMTVPLSQDLPPEFYKLAGAQSYNTIDEPQLKLAISKYEEVLKRTRNIVKSPPAVTTFITDVRSPVDALSRELQKRNDNLRSEMEKLNKTIASTGRSVYGKTVTSSSFTSLLVVFVLVFAAIMIIPRFYSTSVAENILKSEFLLQFSTVFVLIAAIIILAIGTFIQPDQVPVLLAGISGYVLGQLGSKSGGAAVPVSSVSFTPPPATPPSGAQVTPPPATPPSGAQVTPPPATPPPSEPLSGHAPKSGSRRTAKSQPSAMG